MNEFSAIAEKAARTAGGYLLSKFRTSFRIEKKGVIDLVTEPMNSRIISFLPRKARRRFRIRNFYGW
jgi:hypothetical protein